MTTLLHLLLALAVHGLLFVLLRGPARGGLPLEAWPTAFDRLIVLGGFTASLLAIIVGALNDRRRELLVRDAVSMLALLLPLAFALTRGASRDEGGIVLALTLALRFAPVVMSFVAGAIPHARVLVLLAFAWYAPFAAWTLVASYAQGDQPHFLLAAEALRTGTLDLTPLYQDGRLFAQLSGAMPTPEDLETHSLALPAGTRLPQGYIFPLLLLPGWIVGHRLGAEVIVAAIAALAAVAAFELMRDVAQDRPATRVAWLCLAALAPFATLATHIYPNVLGALLLALAFRLAATSPGPRPFAAGLAAGATFLLTPRDALTAGLLLLWVVLARRPLAIRLAAGMGVMSIVAGAVDFVTMGVPLPFAGYVAGLFAFAQARESALWLRPDLGLLGMLFDRAFGLVGSAPWIFIGALGAIPLWRAQPRAAPALLLGTFGTLAGLAFYRLWEGGWAPPNRYLVDVLPLWTPFVAAAFAVARSVWERALAGVLVAWSALATIAFLGVPTWSYSVEESRLIEVLRPLPVDPLTWLPSFHVAGASPMPAALALAVVLIAIAALGTRRRIVTE
ncbi:MAG: hypothetical protein AUH85_05035 [Chloroflexi bacterium 13_1_40CM_4_68_4]|nr:MAG: hypothetical protein AUH85_05035 [Chloroflexi bacterium 13_1_40CM_4_68_4]